MTRPMRSGCADLPLPVHAVGPSLSSYCYAPRFIPWMRRNASRYDHVIVNGIWQFHSFGTRQALRTLGIPYFLYTHGMLDPWFKRTYPLKHLKKSLYWPWAEYRVLRDAQAVCFTCEEERVLARQSFTRYRCKEAVVSYGTAVPAGDPEAQRRAYRAKFPALCDKRLLLFLGRLHPKKGCDLLIEAFAHVAERDAAMHLVMAGPDQTGWQAHLQALAAHWGIADRITWPGMLSGDLKWGAFHAADAFVLPSHQENFGIAVAEALACGLPVLISNKVNIWREIEADQAGLVAPDTVEGTTRLLSTWVSLPLAERQAMQRQAQDTFQRRFEITNAAQSLLRVLSAKEAEQE